MKNLPTTLLSIGAMIASIIAPAVAQTPTLGSALHHANAGRGGAVAAEEKIAAQVGAEILGRGGNAVDAAVATSFALAVTFPRAGNLAGGGFMMIYEQESNNTVAIDYRETAPAAATADMYLREDGSVDQKAIGYSHLAAGVPGTVAGLLYALEKYGTMSRKQVLAPAIRLAKDGYPLPYFAAAMLSEYRAQLSENPAARAEFYKSDGSAYLPGEKLKRSDLAKTLKAIERHGRDGFYTGWVADAIVADMAANNGIITHNDLIDYKVSEREPIWGEYRGYKIASMPPPSSGGILLVEMLNMLETLPPHRSHGDSAEHLHFLAEVMRRVYADRAVHLGDTDFITSPIDGLTSKQYARDLASTINTDSASDSDDIHAGDPAAYESPDTTHISVIDAAGNMVSSTYTLNYSFGSGIVVPGTGITLNNEMDDFAAAPGVPNFYGLIGSEANAIAAGKRPLSSMSPTLVFNSDGDPLLATGAPGGARIITSVLNVLLNVIDRGMSIAEATDHPRIHHQWLPDALMYEPGLSDDTKALLEAKGHELRPLDWYARPQSVMFDDGWVYAYSDSRMPGGGACTPDGGC